MRSRAQAPSRTKARVRGHDLRTLLLLDQLSGHRHDRQACGGPACEITAWRTVREDIGHVCCDHRRPGKAPAVSPEDLIRRWPAKVGSRRSQRRYEDRIFRIRSYRAGRPAADSLAHGELFLAGGGRPPTHRSSRVACSLRQASLHLWSTGRSRSIGQCIGVRTACNG